MKTSLVLVMLIVALAHTAAKGDEYFNPISSLDQIKGCWKRINFPEDLSRRLNKIQLNPDLEYQWYCFFDNNELFSFQSNNDDNLSELDLIKRSKIFPPVIEYSMPTMGIILIRHKDIEQTVYWATSIVAKNVSLQEDAELEEGDIFMSIRNFETGEDLYYRQLRKLQ